jgi:hypothetical protein
MNPLAIIFAFVFGVVVGAFGAYRALLFMIGELRLVSCMTCEEQARLHLEAGGQNHCDVELPHVHGILDTRFSRGQLMPLLVSDEVLEMLKPFPEARFQTILEGMKKLKDKRPSGKVGGKVGGKG